MTTRARGTRNASHTPDRTATQRIGRRIAVSCLGLAAGPLLCVGNAAGQAGGIYLPENGGPSNGTAQAGSAAIARDAETSFLNPAGMTRLDSTEVMLSLMPFYLDIEFNPSPLTTIPGTDGGQQGGWLPAGGLFVAAPVNEHVALGFSATSPAGIVLDPDDAWVGRSWVSKSTLIGLNLEPSLGVRLNDQWSVGAAIDIQYATLDQEMFGPGPRLGLPLGIHGRSWDVGFSASLLWEPLETTRIGFRYRSQVDHELSGDLTIATRVPLQTSTSLTLPMSATLSAYHDFTEQFALMLDVGWTDWSVFDATLISFDRVGNAVALPRNFKDTWNVSLGTHIRPVDRWLVMAGVGYVSSSVSDANRTPDLAVDQQVRVSLGLEYQINDKWTVGGTYTFIWLGDNKIDQSRPADGRIIGDYDAFGHLFSVYGSLRF